MDRVLKAHFDSHRTIGSLPPELEGFSGRLFPDLEKLSVWRNAVKGLSMEHEGMKFKGALDDLFQTPENLYVPVDFKTRGYPIKEDTPKSYQLQMDCYSLLLEKNSLPPAGFAILLFYHPLKVNASHNVEFHAQPVKIKTSP